MSHFDYRPEHFEKLKQISLVNERVSQNFFRLNHRTNNIRNIQFASENRNNKDEGIKRQFLPVTKINTVNNFKSHNTKIAEKN